MNRKKLKILAAALLCGSLLFTGCSFTDAMDKLLGHTEKKADEDVKENVEKTDIKIVDSTMEKPSFTTNLEGSIQIPVGASDTVLTVDAAVSDGGTVTYQWYTNNVNSNGGGEPLSGQTQNTCVPDASAEGMKYYFVVATNNKDDHIAMSVSGVVQVQVVPEGSWTEANGQRQFQLYDGTLVTGWKDIDGQRYAFDENGNMRSGWFKDVDEAWYYLNPDGTMAKDVEIDGFAIGSDGTSSAKKQAVEAEAAAAAQAAAEAAAAAAAQQSQEPTPAQ